MKTILTIFGATGNLMHKKLIPAISSLMKQERYKDDLEIICVSRRDYTLEKYISHLQENVSNDIDMSPLLSHLTYMNLDIHNLQDYENLKKTIFSFHAEPIQTIFYLSVSPSLFVDIARGISHSKLVEKGNKLGRIVFEKPFGENFESAQKINEQLCTFFDEEQISRIDHYLGKDMVQNILVMRFANILFANNWNSDSIKSVHIIAKETDGIGARGGYYDSSGAIKDMVQSHLLQMLSLIAMEEPKSFAFNDIRKEKIAVLLKTSVDVSNIVKGQYDSYHNEAFVLKDSLTETFVFLKVKVNTPRWKNVPFYLMTGKNLDEKRSEIVINFKDHPSASKLWPTSVHKNNKLTIRVAKEEGIRFQLNVKKHGLSHSFTEAMLEYCHDCQKVGNNPEAYEILLNDVIDNNPSSFTSWQEIETSWNIVEPLINNQSLPTIYQTMKDLEPSINIIQKEDFR